ncbi:porin family protein [Leeuwenhoekiella sp. A16]|uniref:porin family protein n=1 Tax=unclassified Leeuwenhoekiella TaxID=2615029 RepID=UPI003A80E798|tara:strand:+ start:131891 stop:132490 length:600 start_codon:yes stop_codon:yes gene_type:complete
MKKLIALATVLVLGTGAANAQEFVQFGVKGGVNFATITGDDFDSPDSRTSFNVGLLAEVPLSERFSIQPEVLYSGQGFDAVRFDQDNALDNDQNVEYQLDYVQVPVLAKIYLVDGLSLQAGPSFNFKVNEEIDSQPNDDEGDFDLDSAQDFEFGGAAGLEYKFANGFLIQGRYNYGFTETFEDSDAHNSTFQVGVGFMF